MLITDVCIRMYVYIYIYICIYIYIYMYTHVRVSRLVEGTVGRDLLRA